MFITRARDKWRFDSTARDNCKHLMRQVGNGQSHGRRSPSYQGLEVFEMEKLTVIKVMSQHPWGFLTSLDKLHMPMAIHERVHKKARTMLLRLHNLQWTCHNTHLTNLRWHTQCKVHTNTQGIQAAAFGYMEQEYAQYGYTPSYNIVQ